MDDVLVLAREWLAVGWVQAILVVVGAIIAGKVLDAVVCRTLSRLAKKSDTEIVFARNKLYWDRGVVELDGIVMRFLASAGAASEAFNQGLVHWATNWDSYSWHTDLPPGHPMVTGQQTVDFDLCNVEYAKIVHFCVS